MPKYSKSARKNIKHSKRLYRGGYWLYPSPGDDVHVFTKLKGKIFPSSIPSFTMWNSSTPAEPSQPVDNSATTGALDYALPAPPASSEQSEVVITDESQQGGRRRRYRRTTKRRRNNKRKRTNKRRR